MHELYDLKDMLCKELEDYGRKENINADALNVMDSLARTIKNLNKIIEAYEEENEGSYRDGGSYRNGSYRDGSYARGRGRNARRDSMGRYSSNGYSRADNMVDKLYGLMEDAPDERTRQEIQKLVSKMETM